MSITSYFLALFVSEYLRTNQPKLVVGELETPKVLEESILSGSIIRSDGHIN